MQSLKKIINNYIRVITIILIITMLMTIVGIQIVNEHQRALDNANIIFSQMELLLAENQAELVQIKESYSQTCLHSAEAIAYIIENDPSVLESTPELKKIAAFIEVDEIHIFDKTGRIYAGTHPEYYNFTFDSGDQMMFFKPMLTDKSLKLVQDITPNTAEGKMMQYSALWSKNKEFIVQVGMEPVSVMNTTEKNELSYIFSLFRVNPEYHYYAINSENYEIIGSTDLEAVGKNYAEIGFQISDITKNRTGFHAKINGKPSFCVFTMIDSNYIGRVITSEVLYQRIPFITIILALCLVLIACILVFVVTRCMNHYVIDGIYGVNQKLRTIASGNLDETVDIQSSIEFSELSSYINDMIKSLLDNNKKMSYVLSKTNMYIGVYEYNKHMKKVRFTEYIPQILLLDNAKAEELSSDYVLFQSHLQEIYQYPVTDEKGIFKLPGAQEHYIRLEELNDHNEIFGVVIDVTDEIIRRRKIEAERDIDTLTGLYNRRGLDMQLSALLSNSEELGYGALIMLDADGLKEINDTHGHAKGDVYLQKIAGIINNFGLKSSIAARLGGDEFVLFLYDYDDEEELLNTIKTLEYIQNHSTAKLGTNLSVPLRFSLGYSLTNQDTDYTKLLNEADTKMYQNKRERKAT